MNNTIVAKTSLLFIKIFLLEIKNFSLIKNYVYCTYFSIFQTFPYFLQIKKKFQMVKKRRNLTVIHNKDCFLYQGSELNKRKEEIAGLDQGQKLAKVDTIFLYVFPITFVAFNIVYWPFWSTYDSGSR